MNVYSVGDDNLFLAQVKEGQREFSRAVTAAYLDQVRSTITLKIAH